MSRKTRNLIRPLPGMATFAIVAALAILVALPVGIALAQQESNPPPPTELTAERAKVDPGNRMDTAEVPYTEIILKWKAPTQSDGTTAVAGISGYRIDVSEDADVWEELMRTLDDRDADCDSGIDCRYPHTVGMAGEARHYRVFANYTDGNVSHPAVTAKANPASTADPLNAVAPTGLTAMAISATQIDLAWTPPADPPGAMISAFEVLRSPNGRAPWTVVATVDEDLRDSSDVLNIPLSHSDEDIMPSTEYYYYVRAKNAAGDGLPSNTDRATTHAAAAVTKPVPPTGLVAYPDGANKIMLVWNATSVIYDHDGNPSNDGESVMIEAVGYRIQVSRSCQDATDTVTSDTDPCSGHNSGTEMPSMGNNGNGGVVYVGDDRSWTTLISNTGSPSTTYVHTGLSPESLRDYRVYSINANGESATPSMSARAMTTAAEAPGIPKAPMLTVSDGNPPQEKVVLNWDRLISGDAYADETDITNAQEFVDAPEDDPVDSFVVEFSTDNAQTWQVAPEGTVTEKVDADMKQDPNSSDAVKLLKTTYIHEDLMSDTELWYRVRGVNDEGRGAASTEVYHETGPPLKANAPTKVEASDTQAGQIVVTWTASEKVAGTPVTGYRVQVSEDGISWLDVDGDVDADVDGSTTRYVHTGLTGGDERSYRVFAINAAGQSDPSDTADGTAGEGTSPTVPGEPEIVSAVVSGNTITVTWTDGADADSHDVALYSVPDFGIVVPRTDVTGSQMFSSLAPGTYVVVVISVLGDEWDYDLSQRLTVT